MALRGIGAGAYRGVRAPKGADRSAAQRLSAGFQADAPNVPSGHFGNPAPRYVPFALGFRKP